MEIRARYILMGLFLLAVIAGGFGFVYWLNNSGGFGERASYRVRFENSVSGLYTGSAVLFNGIRVGEVAGAAAPGRPAERGRCRQSRSMPIRRSAATPRSISNIRG